MLGLWQTEGGDIAAAKRIKGHSCFVQVSILFDFTGVLCCDLGTGCSCVTVRSGTDPKTAIKLDLMTQL